MTQNMAVTTLSLLARGAVHLGAGAIGALGALSGAVLALVTLFLSRRVPHHRAAASAAGGMGALVVALLVLAIAPSFGVLVAGAVLLGAAGGIVMPGLLNAILSVAGHERERAIAIYTVVLSISLAAGPLLETFVLSLARQDVRIPFVVFAVFPLLGAPLAYVVSRQQRHDGSASEVASPEPALVADVCSKEVAALDSGMSSLVVTLGDTRRGRRWRPGLLSTRLGRSALVAQLLYGVPFAGITVFGALVAHVGFGFNPARTQLGFTVFFVLSFGARAAIAWRAPIMRKRPLITLSGALTVAGLLLLALGHGAWALFVAMGMLGIPHGLTFPLALALVSEATPVEALPRANATLLGSTNITSVIVPLILGGIIPVIGYRNMTLVLLGPVLAFAAVQIALKEGRPVTPVVERRKPRFTDAAESSELGFLGRCAARDSNGEPLD